MAAKKKPTFSIKDRDAKKYELHLSPKLKAIAGVVKLPDNFNEKTALLDYYENKIN